MNLTLRGSRRCLAVFLGLGLLLGASVTADSQEPRGPVKVVVKDGKVVTLEEPAGPVDATPRIRIGTTQFAFNFGLSVDNKRLCCGPDSSIWLQARIDGQEVYVGQSPNGNDQLLPKELPPGPLNKKRQGKIWTWQHGDLHFTQIVEIVPGKPTVGKVAPGQKRLMDTCRISQFVENKGKQARKVELRQGIDIMINNNDGTLFASPKTHPGKILNGIELKGKELADFIQVLEQPNLDNPGFVATMTFKMGGKAKSPTRVLCTNLGSVSQWNAAAQQAGDAACAIQWDPYDLKPGMKQEFAWGYGGGYACNPDNDGMVSIALGGSFEPNKVFTVTAYVDDPSPNQTLALELPAGMERVEGRDVQPVPVPPETSATSIVMWKARVLRPGDYDLKVRSSTGVTKIKTVSITAP